MKKTFSYMTRCGLSVLAFFFLALAQPAIAGTIRIIGDRTPVIQNNSEGATAAEPPSSSVGGSAIIGFNGDKLSSGQKPTSEQAARPEPDQSTAAIKEYRSAEKEYTAPTTVEGESLSKETAEQQLAKRLESLKAEEKRKAGDKAEQDQPAQPKAEQENKAAAAKEQEQPATGKAEESRTGAEQPSVPTIADEECLTAAAIACKEEDTPTAPSVYSPTDVKPFILKPFTSEITERLPEQNLAIEPAQPKSSSNSDFPLEYWLMQMRTKFQEQWRHP
jgi:hypothetical protein